ncbi:hypothetical protein C8R44DRAFT_770271 [Mycena epipterygia]|nr:hypothetical protein C8R44DRAFT_770271 [Mycena epipterygia]
MQTSQFVSQENLFPAFPNTRQSSWSYYDPRISQVLWLIMTKLTYIPLHQYPPA